MRRPWCKASPVLCRQAGLAASHVEAGSQICVPETKHPERSLQPAHGTQLYETAWLCTTKHAQDCRAFEHVVTYQEVGHQAFTVQRLQLTRCAQKTLDPFSTQLGR